MASPPNEFLGRMESDVYGGSEDKPPVMLATLICFGDSQWGIRWKGDEEANEERWPSSHAAMWEIILEELA